MPVVKWESDTIQSKALEEGSVLILEEIFEELRTDSVNSFGRSIKAVILTLSKKKAAFFSPSTSARASLIWNSQPGYPS